jgi:hypothetical protein
VEQSSHGLFQGSIPAFDSRDWENKQRNSVIVIGTLAKIQTGHFLNAGQKFYCLDQLAWYAVVKTLIHMA